MDRRHISYLYGLFMQWSDNGCDKKCLRQAKAGFLVPLFHSKRLFLGCRPIVLADTSYVVSVLSTLSALD